MKIGAKNGPELGVPARGAPRARCKKNGPELGAPARFELRLGEEIPRGRGTIDEQPLRRLSIDGGNLRWPREGHSDRRHTGIAVTRGSPSHGDRRHTGIAVTPESPSHGRGFHDRRNVAVAGTAVGRRGRLGPPDAASGDPITRRETPRPLRAGVRDRSPRSRRARAGQGPNAAVPRARARRFRAWSKPGWRFRNGSASG